MNQAPANATIWQKMMSIDRRIIYVIVAFVMIIPIIFPFNLPLRITKRTTQALFDAVEKFPKSKGGHGVFLISADLSPQDQPELYPMMVAWIRHCFYNGTKVLVMCLYANSLGLAEQALNQVSIEFNNRAQDESQRKVYGRDFVFLGWKPPPIVPILGLGENIFDVFPKDFYGNELQKLPMMDNIKSYRDMDMIGSIAAGALPITYVAYAQARYGIKVTGGVTAVSVADFYPYLDSGQLTGMLEGMKGAAEYEELVTQAYGDTERRLATEGMSAQSTTHIAIILMVILGNVCYFMQRRYEKRREL
jgi:hypothetical protein